MEFVKTIGFVKGANLVASDGNHSELPVLVDEISRIFLFLVYRESGLLTFNADDELWKKDNKM